MKLDPAVKRDIKNLFYFVILMAGMFLVSMGLTHLMQIILPAGSAHHHLPLWRWAIGILVIVLDLGLVVLMFVIIIGKLRKSIEAFFNATRT